MTGTKKITGRFSDLGEVCGDMIIDFLQGLDDTTGDKVINYLIGLVGVGAVAKEAYTYFSSTEGVVSPEVLFTGGALLAMSSICESYRRVHVKEKN